MSAPKHPLEKEEPQPPMSSCSSTFSSDASTIHSTPPRTPSRPGPKPVKDDNECEITLSHQVSHTNDLPLAPYNSHISIDPAVYDRIPPKRKLIIVAIISFCSFLAPLASTTVLSAVPEVSETYNTTGTIINISNALYMLFMGISPTFWGPMSQIYGRRWVSYTTSLLSCDFGLFALLELQISLLDSCVLRPRNTCSRSETRLEPP